MGKTPKIQPQQITQKTPEELRAIESNRLAIEQLTEIQGKQFAQFEEFAPIQRAAFERQEAQAIEADRIRKLTQPLLFKEAGVRGIFGEEGELTGFEDIEKTPAELARFQFEEESAQQALLGIRGEIPVGEPFEKRVKEQREALLERIDRQGGPGGVDSSFGAQALAEFDAKANEARESIRFGRLTQTSALADRSAAQQNQQVLQSLGLLGSQGRAGQSGAVNAAGLSLSQSAQTGLGAAGAAGQFANFLGQDRRAVDAFNRDLVVQNALNKSGDRTALLGLIGSLGGAAFTAGGAGIAGSSTGTGAGKRTGFNAIFSSEALKENNTAIDNEEILDGVKNLRVEGWNYIQEVGVGDDAHIGPYAEEMAEQFGIGDGKTIKMIDAMGILFAAVQGLEKRTAKVGGD